MNSAKGRKVKLQGFDFDSDDEAAVAAITAPAAIARGLNSCCVQCSFASADRTSLGARRINQMLESDDEGEASQHEGEADRKEENAEESKEDEEEMSKGQDDQTISLKASVETDGTLCELVSKVTMSACRQSDLG